MDIEEYSKNLYKIETYYWWFRAKRKFLIKILEKLKPHFKNYEKLLDIGCGAGENMKQIQKIMQVVGIDMSIGAVKFCKKRGL